jgi:AcrR family transcriptional regulator
VTAAQPAGDKATETRERILAGACATIAEVGLEKVRMWMVAKRAGVSTALLHYHFSNRETLFAEALRYSFETSGRAVYEAEGPAERTWSWRLARIVEAMLPVNAELRQDSLLWQELWLRAARDAESRELAVRLYADMHKWVVEAIRGGIDAGEFTPAAADPDAVAELVLALVDGYSARLTFDDPLVDLPRATGAIWSVLVDRLGVGAPFPER